MGEGSTQAGFVVALLALGDPQVSHGLLTIRGIAAHKALDGVQDRARAVKVLSELRHPRECPCHSDVGCSMWVQDEAKRQATIDAQGDGVRLGNNDRKGLEPKSQGLRCFFTRVAALAYRDQVTGMGDRRGDILRQTVAAAGQSGDVSRQLPQFAAGQKLLVGMVFFQDGQALQFGVGFGQGQDGEIARRDGLDFSVGELLSADVLGTAHGAGASHDLGDEPGFRL